MIQGFIVCQDILCSLLVLNLEVGIPQRSHKMNLKGHKLITWIGENENIFLT